MENLKDLGKGNDRPLLSTLVKDFDELRDSSFFTGWWAW
jgi:hypothetical protein